MKTLSLAKSQITSGFLVGESTPHGFVHYNKIVKEFISVRDRRDKSEFNFKTRREGIQLIKSLGRVHLIEQTDLGITEYTIE